MNTTINIADGYCEEDLHQPGYYHQLAEAGAAVVALNRHLIERAQSPDFDPVVELDRTRNGAAELNHDFFEAIALYTEGRVPWFCVSELRESTELLHKVLAKRKDAPIAELDESGVSFRLVNTIAGTRLAMPRCKNETYLKKLFDCEARINKALDAVHRKYVEQAMQKAAKKTRHHRRDEAGAIVKRSAIAQANRKRVFTEISRLYPKKIHSLIKTIHYLRQCGTYNTYLGHIKDETWRRYYNGRKR